MDFDLGPDLRLAQPQVQEDYAVLAEVLSRITAGKGLHNGWALEFGVATGKTLTMIADVLPVIGFDSFEGLPEDWRENFPAITFAGVRPAHPIPGSTLVEGLFSETLPGFDWPDTISLVHLDADLYSSTKTVLDELAYAVQPGTYLVFDEFFGYEGSEAHEERAFAEFIDGMAIERGLSYEVIGHGREQWAVQIR